MRKAFAIFALALSAFGCAAKPGAYAVSADDAQRFGKRIARLNASHGPVLLAAERCAIYMAHAENGYIVSWKRVFEAEGTYPRFMTVCTDQQIENRQGYIEAYLCAQAIGAGGGCANGGSYRTHDGLKWEKWRNRSSRWTVFNN